MRRSGNTTTTALVLLAAVLVATLPATVLGGAAAAQSAPSAGGLDRRICDDENAPVATPTCEAPYARAEGDPPVAEPDVNLVYDRLGTAYDFFFTRFGRDSLDGAGMPLVATVRTCAALCPNPNASWNDQSEQFFVGSGWAAATDLLAHEFTHGVLTYTSALSFAGQAGAVNESLADVFGELVDLTDGQGNDTPAVRWLIGEDLASGPIRSMVDPPAFGAPDRMGSPLYAAADGEVHLAAGVGNRTAVLIVDGGTFNGRTVRGLGIDKAAQLYYQLITAHLVSGMNWQQLGRALGTSCGDLVGLYGITLDDCRQVRTAVDATELLRAAPGTTVLADAPVCDAVADPVTPIFSDDLEDLALPNWVIDNSPPPGWASEDLLAAQGLRAVLAQTSPEADATFATAVDVPVPVGQRSFLRFQQSPQLNLLDEPEPNAGVVELSTDQGATWFDAGDLFTENGYDGTVPAGSDNVLAGREAFVVNRPDYAASRLELTSLAGQDVRVRFRFGTSADAFGIGWYVDDVRIYGCGHAPGPYVPTMPARVLDTRAGIGGPVGRIGPGGSVDLLIAGHGGVPDTGAAAVVLNVTGVFPSEATHLTAWPTGAARPTTSNLNLPAGDVRANAVTVPIGMDGRISFFNNAGTTDLVVDVVGWYAPAEQLWGARFDAVEPVRVVDTRDGTGVPAAKLGPGERLTVSTFGVAKPNIAAIVLNVTGVAPTAATHLSVTPTAVASPPTSSLNLPAGETRANQVISQVAGSDVVVTNNAGWVDVVVDVVGWYVVAAPPPGLFAPVLPDRVLDTRDGTGAPVGRLGPGEEVTVDVTDVTPVDATAVAVNLTAVNPSAATHLTAWDGAGPVPGTSTLNVPAGRTAPNASIVSLDTTGGTRRLTIRNNTGTVDVLVDLVGWFT